jgi:sugar (pentulose or hexulose) kinase
LIEMAVMSADLLLGIDAGTSVVKAALFDWAGKEFISAAHRTTLSTPHEGWSETSMEETWQAAVVGLRELLAQPGIDKERIAAIGVSGNMIGTWLIDEQGKPVRDAILWNDGRTVSLLDQLRSEHPGFDTQVFRISGSVIEHGATLPLLRWLADHEPETLERAHVILHSKDWIRYKLTGEIVTDITEVPGTPGDVRRRDYSDEVLALFGLGSYRRLFPRIAPSQQVVGYVTSAAAEMTGLAEGTPVVAGAGDVPAVVLGVGAVQPGIACSILGTHSINGVILDHPSFEPMDVGLLFTIPEQRWMRALTNVAGTTNLDWFTTQFCALELSQSSSSAELFAQLESLVRQVPPGARGVMYHPYLSAVGIMAPFFEPAARAQFFGLTREHMKADLLRAVYEGVALAIRDCYAAMGAVVHEIRLSGGGARSGIWGQIIADTVGTPVVIPEGTEFGTRGAALLAGVGIGWFDSIVDAAAAAIQIDRVCEPDLNLKPLYDENYALYCALRDSMRAVWRQAASRSFLSV